MRREDNNLSRRSFLKKTVQLGLGAVAALSPKDLLAQPTNSPELSDNADLTEISNYITQHREPVDYTKLWTPDLPVLFVGERHTVKSDKDEIIKNLPTFKQLGMTHLAMEMLLEDQQPLINDYIAGNVKREQVLETCFSSWDRGLGMGEKYMELVDAARMSNINIVAIDLTTDSGKYLTGEFFRKRNNNWARIAGSIIEDKKAKILFYCGQGHSDYNMIDDSANEILKGMDIKSKVVEFAGGEVASDDPYVFRDKIGKAAQNLNLGGEKFGLHINTKDDVRGMDYVIHLPQTEKRYL